VPSKPRTWKCQRVRGGVKCATVNAAVKQRCTGCGAPRPPRKREAHFDVLKLPYEVFVLVNGGSENCGICGAPPTTKHNDRDHEHAGGGLVRGLLCHDCNRALGRRQTSASRGDLIAWLRRAADYLERAERWRGVDLSKFV
jgi:hypothetical protein